MHLPHQALVVTGAAVTLCSVAFAGAATAAAGTRHVISPRAAASGGTWGSAQVVPGTAQLNQDGYAYVQAVSCATAGNCGAGGVYRDGRNRQQGFVVNETNGKWRTAKNIPGMAILNKGPVVMLTSVSCASAGNCSAGGSYIDGDDDRQPFVVSETNGTWGAAREVPGAAALNQGGIMGVSSVSCRSAGNCSAGGYYTDAASNQQVFVVSETNGTWGTAEQVPGTAALNAGGLADFFSVSCGTAGNCGAGGDYTDGSGHRQAFVLDETNGVWATAVEVPGTAVLNQGGSAYLSSVSCASAGNCSAGGTYSDASGNAQAFVVGEANGVWATAVEVPGTAALNAGGLAELDTVSCVTGSYCSGGGYYRDGSGHLQAFVVNKTGPTWGAAKEVPGTAALNSGRWAQTNSVSCGSAGNCSAGGFYTDSFNHMQAFVVSETNGTWHGAIEVPGTVVLNQGGDAATNSVSCASAGHCSAGGSYRDSSKLLQAFVVNET